MTAMMDTGSADRRVLSGRPVSLEIGAYLASLHFDEQDDHELSNNR